MNTKLVLLFVFQVVAISQLSAMEKQQGFLEDAFTPKKEFFCDEVKNWQRNMILNGARASEKYEPKSDYAMFMRELAKEVEQKEEKKEEEKGEGQEVVKDFTIYCDNQFIAARALIYWRDDISTRKRLQRSYQKGDFATFREKYKEITTKLMEDETGIVMPNHKPKEQNLLKKIFEANKNVKLNAIKKEKYRALLLIQMASRQLHINAEQGKPAEEKTDDPNMLVSKEITNPPSPK